jgi:hypothetical protein
MVMLDTLLTYIIIQVPSLSDPDVMSLNFHENKMQISCSDLTLQQSPSPFPP